MGHILNLNKHDENGYLLKQVLQIGTSGHIKINQAIS